MHLLLVNRFGHRIGGIEVHLQNLVPALLERGHEVSFLHEEPIPPGHEPVVGPEVRRWVRRGETAEAVLGRVRDTRPDVVYAHEQVAPEVLCPLVDGWPSAWFAHAYSGACVSGSKCWKWPVARPCARPLDWLCLLHFFPHRCGGLNPVTMFRLFRQQRAVQAMLRRFDLLGTHSEHMRTELLRQGMAEDRVRVLPFPVRGAPGERGRPPERIAEGPLRLLYLGRFDALKGGALLLEAMPAIARRLRRPLVLTMAGEGPERSGWERAAAAAREAAFGVEVVFPGWLGGSDRNRALAMADLMLVPSVWPEPFGMTGIEAAHLGVPSVAFDVGGIRAWLEPGVSGELAAGDPPSARGLVEAVVRAAGDAGHYGRLSAGARIRAGRFTLSGHVEALEAFLGEAMDRRGAAERPPRTRAGVSR